MKTKGVILISKLIQGAYALLFVGTLILVSLFENDWNMGTLQRSRTLPTSICICIAGIVLASLALYAQKHAQNPSHALDKRRKYLWYGIFGVFWLVFMFWARIRAGFVKTWDPTAILGAAVVGPDGIPGTWFEPYFLQFPNNLFLTGALYSVSRILGVNALLVASVITILIVALAGIMLLEVVHRRLANTKLFFVTAFLFTALVIINPWFFVFYSDTVGLFFIALSLFVSCVPKKSFVKICLLFVVALSGYYIKPTIIFMPFFLLIPELVVYVKNVKRIPMKEILIIVLLAVGTIGGVKATTGVMKIDSSSERVFGLPHYLMLGLNDVVDGVYNVPDVKYSESFATNKERNEGDLQEAKRRFDRLFPLDLLKLYIRKLTITYRDASFSWNIEGNGITYDFSDKTSDAQFLKSIYWAGENEGVWMNFAQIQWVFVLVSALTGAVVGFRKNSRDRYASCCMIAILAITVFTCIFEARARYIYLYLPVYIFLAVFGIHRWYKNFVREPQPKGEERAERE